MTHYHDKKQKVVNLKDMCKFVFRVYFLFSSPEHEVLMVSFCDRSMSVVRRASSVVRRASSVVRRPSCVVRRPQFL